MSQAALYFHNDAVETGAMEDQAQALQSLADDLVKTSSVNGAMMGAAVGCGLSVLSTGAATKCLTSAAVGMAGGAVIGHQAGTQTVSRGVDLVPQADVSRTLRNATRQYQTMALDLPDYLAAQEAELTELTLAFANGEIDRATHDRRIEQIKADRATIAEALTLSARDVARSHKNLQTAAARGQTGLDWHLETAGQLAADVASERARISLF